MKALLMLELIIPVLVIISVFAYQLHKRIKRRKAEEIIPKYTLFPYGTGYFPPDEIFKLSTNATCFVPHTLRRHAAPKLTKNDIDAIISYVNCKDDPEFDFDPIRMINAKASLYKIQLPENAIIADGRTLGFLIYLMNALEPVTPIADTDAKEYHQHLPTVGQAHAGFSQIFVKNLVLTFLIREGDKQSEPYMLHEWLISKTIADGAARRMGLHDNMLFTSDIVRSTITAYAIKVGIKIPRDYIRYDEVTIHFLNTMKKFEEKSSHLRLIQGN